MTTSMKAMGFEVPQEKLRMAGCGSYADAINTLERAVSENRFIAGDHFTAADVYVGAHVGWGLQFGTIEKRPAFTDYMAHLTDRPAFKRATQLDEAAAKDMQAAG
jgi:glutathione S-transferase